MTFALAPTLETNRFISCAPTGEDFEAYTEFAADRAVMRYIGGVQARSMAWRGLCSIRRFGARLLHVLDTGKVVGPPDRSHGTGQPEGWPGTEVGCALVREYWGKGYATGGGHLRQLRPSYSAVRGQDSAGSDSHRSSGLP